MGFRYHFHESSPLEPSENVQLSPGDSSIDIKPIIYNEAPYIIKLEDFQNAAKFHIGMLTISLIAGLGYGGYVTYKCWREKKVFLSHVRNLVIALTCRSFFSILFDGVVILESFDNVDGGNTLQSFECISLNLVIAFWLTFTIYLHARVQSNCNSEPTLKLYMLGVPGVAVYFAFVWIFAMEGSHPSQIWWLVYQIIEVYQWIVNSLRLLYLLVQVALLVDIGRMMMVKSTDNDTVSLMRKVALMMAILVLLFWLQFGLSVGRPPLNNPQPYLYFNSLIDGTQCALVCLVLFFFNMWVPMILDKLPNMFMESGEMAGGTSRSNDEVLIRGNSGRGIVTIDSIFMTPESKRRTNSNSDGCEDIIYSSVVQPQNLQKTIDLYKRLNAIPVDKVTIVQGEKFFDCDLGNNLKKSKLLPLNHARSLEPDTSETDNKMSEKAVKKNAFYSSKYLILNCKEKDIPTYLETRPRISSNGKETSGEEELSRDPSTSLESLEVVESVKKWLRNHSDEMKSPQQKRQLSASFH